jgi:hypothetical protein
MSHDPHMLDMAQRLYTEALLWPLEEQMNRSPERTEFLRDILTGAVEGGTGYWAQVSQYQWVDRDGTVMVVVGERAGDDAHATLHRLNEDESGYELAGLDLNVETIATGVNAIVNGRVATGERYRKGITQANAENDAGMIDADDADIIVQAGLLGEIIYG